jgi:hypothetical protein
MTANVAMFIQPPELNLALAWSWVALGLGSGMVLGLFFHREQWLGGYASLKRRLYRLGHISFFGLGVLNLCFYFTVRELAVTGPAVKIAAWAFVAGAIFMPLCCVLMAHAPRLRPLFAVPVLSLLLGGVLTAVVVALPQLPRNHRQSVENTAPLNL